MNGASNTAQRVVVFGAGYTGSRVARLAAERGAEVVATVRSPERAASLAGQGFEVTRDPVLSVAERVDDRTHVIVTFPPDGTTELALAPLVAGARAIAFVSSTGVYGDTTGMIDDSTALPEPTSAHQARLVRAEEAFRAVGGTVLRAPGIYGPDRGLHVRVQSGVHRLPGAGHNIVSRIHADDLAELLLASLDVRGETFVVGDLDPASQREVVTFITTEYGCPFPPSVPPEEVHETLRRDRRIDSRRVLAVLGVTLRYPSYRDGMRRP